MIKKPKSSYTHALLLSSAFGLAFLQACSPQSGTKTVYVTSDDANAVAANNPSSGASAPSTPNTSTGGASPAPAQAPSSLPMPATTANPMTPLPTSPMPASSSPSPSPSTGEKVLVECPGQASIGRLVRWLAGEGDLVPAAGTSLLVKEGDKNVAKVEFRGNDWHVVSVLLTNMSFDTAKVDLSVARSFTVTYSATADLYVQLRPASKWDGGDKHLVKLPATAGVVKSLTIPLVSASWTTLPNLGVPPYTFESALKEARGFVFVGQPANIIKISGLTFDGYEPACP